MSRIQIFVWIDQAIAVAIAFGISYWATVKFHSWWARSIFVFIAVAVGIVGYVAVGSLAGGAAILLGLIDSASARETVRPFGEALGRNLWSALGSIVSLAIAGVWSATVTAKKRGTSPPKRTT
jgi:hypothetical protein